MLLNGEESMKTDKSDILTCLRNSEDYVSGQQLCDRLGVSRTAVWKVINQLKEERLSGSSRCQARVSSGGEPCGHVFGE